MRIWVQARKYSINRVQETWFRQALPESPTDEFQEMFLQKNGLFS
jgi:hypothetical protein